MSGFSTEETMAYYGYPQIVFHFSGQERTLTLTHDAALEATWDSVKSSYKVLLSTTLSDCESMDEVCDYKLGLYSNEWLGELVEDKKRLVDCSTNEFYILSKKEALEIWNI
ncbi:hypothetical protein GGI20_002348 [Coemansia sp. BCRC 34301]|nr:hypothetical protein GGI20_002348 [Coemansia sp. BCRC 34301]